MNQLKEAFNKIKEDISLLRSAVSSLTQEVSFLKDSYESLSSNLLDVVASSIKEKEVITPNYIINDPFFTLYSPSTNNPFNLPSVPSSFDTSTVLSTDPTDNPSLEPLKTPNPLFSSRKQGVSTDRQTDNQTDKMPEIPEKPSFTEFEKVNRILKTLDQAREDIKFKFKALTPQEMLIFSTLYSLEEQGIENITYSTLSTSLKLTESSIRDYITRLVKKGIPIEKRRLNNKKIIIFISKDLKEVTNLSTILKLRDL